MIFKSRALGLELFQNGFSWVMASGTAISPHIERFETVISAEDILKPSMKELNIVNAKALGSSIAESYHKLFAKTVRVSLSIPEACGRALLLEMDTSFKSKEEGIDQVKWKLKKNFPFDMSDVHLDYQELKDTGSGGSTLLVALISRSIINEYEELLLANGLEPSKIDFTTFNLYRLFAPRFELEDQMVFVSMFRGNLIVMIFQDGIIDFFRSKPLGSTMNDPVRLYREINSSILVYSDMKGGWKANRLYCYAPPHARALFRSVIFEVTGTEPILVDTDVFISSSLQRIERAALADTLSALGAASRSLG